LQTGEQLHMQYAAQIKVSKENTSYTFTLTSVTLSAENDALQKASSTQPMGLPIIPGPEKGVAGKGFNLSCCHGFGGK
jgi:hypothetical protein